MRGDSCSLKELELSTASDFLTTRLCRFVNTIIPCSSVWVMMEWATLFYSPHLKRYPVNVGNKYQKYEVIFYLGNQLLAGPWSHKL